MDKTKENNRGIQGELEVFESSLLEIKQSATAIAVTAEELTHIMEDKK